LHARLKTRRARITVSAIAVLVLGTASAAIAAATDNMVPTNRYPNYCRAGNSSGNGSVCQTDNGSVSWYMYPSVTKFASDVTAIRAAIDGSYDPISNLSFTYDSTPVKEGGGETDIMYQEGDILAGGNFLGYTWCDDAVDGQMYSCDQQYIRFRGDQIDRSLTCHETGHALGLLHGNDASPWVDPTNASILGCMANPHDSVNQYLGSNNVDWIHVTY
jgi:hypothetical protein